MYSLGWSESVDQAEVELELSVVDSELSRADVETEGSRGCSAEEKEEVGEKLDSLVRLLVRAHGDHSRIRRIRRIQRAEMREPRENHGFAAGVSTNEPFENLRRLEVEFSHEFHLEENMKGEKRTERSLLQRKR